MIVDKIRMSRRAAAGVVALGLGLAAASVQSQAAVQLRAGLWEHSVRMSSQSGRLEAAMKEAQAAMAAMSPEERRMMEQMMGRQGAQFDVSGGQQRVRVCMTPEEVARDTLPPPQEGCTQTGRRSGNTWTISFQCPARQGEPSSSGQGSVTLQSSTAYAGQFKVSTQVEDRPEQVMMSTQGRWVSADCGSIRPVR
ncbi:DUF3617 domain-containing protein [Sphaerotilus sulfidivorans]